MSMKNNRGSKETQKGYLYMKMNKTDEEED